MPSKGTSAKGIRLPDGVWQAIDSEAKDLGMSRNEYIARRLRRAASCVREVGKTDENVESIDELEIA